MNNNKVYQLTASIFSPLFLIFLLAGILFEFGFNHSGFILFRIVAVINLLLAIYIGGLLPDALIKSGLRVIFRALYRVKVIGIENYSSADERILIVANHTSYLDAALIAAFLPDKLTFAIDHQTSDKWWVRMLLGFCNIYSLNPNNPLSVKMLVQYLKKNNRCVIFPQGRLTVTGPLMKIYESPGLIADKADAKLLPIHIQGAQFSQFSKLRGKVPTRWMPDITITVFPAQTFKIPADVKGAARRELIGIQFYDVMTRLMFESCDYHQTLFQSLIDARKLQGRRFVIVDDITGNSTSYQQLIMRSFVIGGHIEKQTQLGEAVGVLLPNMAVTVAVFFGIQVFSRVPAMLNYSAGIKSIVDACKTADITKIVTSRKFLETIKLTGVIDALQSSAVEVFFAEEMKKNISIFAKLKGFFQAQCPSLSYRYIKKHLGAQQAIGEHDNAVILFTSGSEGTPKGVVLTHQNIQANRFQLSSCIDFNASDKILNVLPIFHAFGLGAGMLLPILAGVPVFLYPSPLHYRMVPQVAYDINATVLFGTDTFLTGYARYAHDYHFYSVRYVFAGAEKLRAETLNTWAKKFGVRIFDGYGATEASPVISSNTPLQHKEGSVGRILPGMNYKLREVPGIEVGQELLISGPNIMKGYMKLDNPGVIEKLIDGWYATGDIVSVDEEGYITIVGRVKRFAKIAGEMISLPMVEHSANVLWPQHQHAVVSIPDAKKGEQLVLVTTEQTASRDMLVSFMREKQLSELTIPRKIVHVEQLPLLGSGKIDYTSVEILASA